MRRSSRNSRWRCNSYRPMRQNSSNSFPIAVLRQHSPRGNILIIPNIGKGKVMIWCGFGITFAMRRFKRLQRGVERPRRDVKTLPRAMKTPPRAIETSPRAIETSPRAIKNIAAGIKMTSPGCVGRLFCPFTPFLSRKWRIMFPCTAPCGSIRLANRVRNPVDTHGIRAYN